MKMHAYAYNGVSAFRVLKDDTLDPRFVETSDYGKFIFDSLNPKQIDLSTSDTYEANKFDDYGPDFVNAFPSSSSPESFYHYFWPNGTNRQTCTHLIRSGYSSVIAIANRVDHGHMITSTQYIDASGWRYFDNVYFNSGSSGSIIDYTYRTFSTWSNFSQINRWRYHISSHPELTGEWFKDGAWLGAKVSHLSWGISGIKGEFFTTPQGPLTSDARFLEVGQRGAKLAHNGYDVRTATREQLLIGEGKNLAQLVVSGTVGVSYQETATINLPSGIQYDDSVFIQLVALDGDDSYNYTFPLKDPRWWIYNQNGGRKGTRARIVNNTLQINNDTIYWRRYLYMVMSTKVAEDDLTATNTDVIKTIDNGAEKYIQWRRLGASEPPNLSDIIFDSRFPRITLVKEGEWDIPSPNRAQDYDTGPKTHTVTFPNEGGWVPFPIWICETHPSPFSFNPNYIFKVGPQIVYRSENHNSYRRYGGKSTWADVRDTSITFTSYAGNHDYPSSTGGSSEGFPINHMKYAIFAIQI